MGVGALGMLDEVVPGEVGQPPGHRTRRPPGCGGRHGAVVHADAALTLWSSLLVLRGQGGDHRVVLVDHAHLGRATGRAEVVEEVDVGVVVVLPLLRGVVLVEDRLDGAHRLAGAAVDALVGVDVEHPLALVDAVDGALVDAGPVLEVDAGLRDDVGHLDSFRCWRWSVRNSLVSRSAAAAGVPRRRDETHEWQPTSSRRHRTINDEEPPGGPTSLASRPRPALRGTAGRRAPGPAGPDRTLRRARDDRPPRGHGVVVGWRHRGP